MRNVVLVIAALVLTACATGRAPALREGESLVFREGGVDPFARAWLIRNDPFVATLARPVRLYPMVYVEDSQIIVDQEPIHVKMGEGQASVVKIEWTIGESGYFFPDDNSVVLKVESGPPPTNVDCRPKGQPPYQAFICRYKRPAGKSKYSYAITVSDRTYTYHSDPYIAND